MRKFWSSFIVVFLGLGLQAQQSGEVSSLLYKKGFENVLVQESADSLKIFFEHREFRNPFHSIRYAKLLLSEMTPQSKEVVWVPMYHNTLMGSYTEGHAYQPLTAEDRLFFREQNSLHRGYRFHFRLQPDLSARFGYYSDPLQVKLNLVLDSRLYLAPGLSLQTGISIPLENSLDAQDMSLKLAPSMLHYFKQPWNSHFFALSVGTFYFDRYGFDLQYRYARFDNDWSFGLESGLTGFYWLNQGSFYAEPMDDLYAVADVEYRLPLEDLSLRLSAGQFLFADKGVRLDLIRQFGAVDVGLHVAHSEAGSSGGFQVAFSLFPGKILRTRKLELRSTEEFRWEYSYNNEEAVAKKFRIGIPRLGDLLRQYNQEMGVN